MRKSYADTKGACRAMITELRLTYWSNHGGWMFVYDATKREVASAQGWDSIYPILSAYFLDMTGQKAPEAKARRLK